LTTTLEKSEIERSSVLISPSPLIPGWEHPATIATAAIKIINILLIIKLDTFEVRMAPNDKNSAAPGQMKKATPLSRSPGMECRQTIFHHM
jgi:hypothetical protein